MARPRTIYRCSECGVAEPKWAGRCAASEAWNSLVEEIERPAVADRDALLGGGAGRGPSTPLPIAEVDMEAWAPSATHVGELDRVLQGGLVPGSVTLLGGEPGIGKSTLLLQALAGLAKAGHRCLYVAAEESAQQVRLRAERLGALPPNLWLVADVALPHLLEHIDTVRPDVVAVDSIQTVFDPVLSSAPGSVAQVRECAHRLVRISKERGVASVLVGHVTKDGSLAGPRVLEHLVDTVLSFEGERHHALRLLRAVKHRFGSIDELGLFEMTESGLAGVPDPSALFLSDRRPGTAGSVVAPVLDGHRPLLVEVQALAVPSQIPTPRRSAQGLDNGRLALVLAVLQQHAHLSFHQTDVHTVVAGGVKTVEPGADLALALALVSAVTGTPAADDLVACGEVGLGGELRQVHQTARRLAEAARLGFRRAIVPASASVSVPGMEVVSATTVAEAIRLADVGPSPRSLEARRAS
ncbi:MAG: DNA repair protein RadA [Acidimicrobiales bacterium]